MERSDRKFLHYINYSVLVTSLLYFVFKYFITSASDWGERPHEFTKYLQSFHILSSCVLVFGVGVIFKSHILKRIVGNFVALRRSGITMLISFVVMVFSGYCIQFLTEATTRQWAVWLHLSSSLMWAMLYGYHHFYGYKTHQKKIGI